VPVIGRGQAVLVAGIMLWSAGRADARAGDGDRPAFDELAGSAKQVVKNECFDRHESGQIARQQRRLRDAQGELRLCSRAACPGLVRADCVEWLEQVSRSVPSVVVTARAQGFDLTEVRVSVDGVQVADRLTGSALELDPGSHRFRFEAPPWPPVERTMLISEGVKERPIDVEFAPAPAAVLATPAGRAQPTRFDYVVGSIGAAALATSASLGIWALVQRHDLQRTCAPFCDQADVDAIKTKLLLADVALGVALASAGIVWFRVALPTASAPSVGIAGAF
jgi:hypothetical protein